MALTEAEGSPPMPTPNEIDEGVLRVFDELDAPEGDDQRMYELGDGRFTLKDDGQADWAARKLTGVTGEIEDVVAQADRQIEAIEKMVEPYLTPIREWRNEQLRRLVSEKSFWEGLLTLYHRDIVLTADPERKTLKLPHGTSASRKSPDIWDFDAEAFITWARNVAPEFIRTKEEVDKDLAKKTLKVNPMGQVVYMRGDDAVPVPSVNVTPGERSFTVKTEGLAQ